MSQGNSNRNFIIGFALIAVVALIYGIANFHRAFPEIAINFQVPRNQAQANALGYLQSRRLDAADYRKSIVFDYDYLAKTYLERELGVERTIELTSDRPTEVGAPQTGAPPVIDVWYWRARFFQPLQKLEYTVKVAPSGEVIGFEREMEEATPGPNLTQENARILAEAFLTGAMSVNLDEWELVESQTQERPARSDHTFTYELKGFKAANAPYRMEVEVQGAEVGKFHRFLKVPEEWRRDYERQRSQNMLFQFIAQFFMFLLLVAVVVHFIRNIRLHQIHWRTALIFGGTLAVLLVIATLNTLPLTMAGYETTDSYGSHFGSVILFGVISALVTGMFIMLLLGSGEYLYRQEYPDKMWLGGFLARRGYRTGEFMQATLVGYIMAAFHVGFVVLFYVIGDKLGFWSPAEVKYTDAVSTALPWIYPLAISVMAATQEEFMFRLFGIPFLRRFLKSLPLAVILQAFIWGFLHSAYPQQPGFVRGIELGLIGIVAGVIMLRFGIWATLTWHFVFDAVVIGLFLFRSDNAYFWISGLVVCGALAIPAIVALVQYIRHRSLAPADGLLNREISFQEDGSPHPSVATPPYSPPTGVRGEDRMSLTGVGGEDRMSPTGVGGKDWRPTGFGAPQSTVGQDSVPADESLPIEVGTPQKRTRAAKLALGAVGLFIALIPLGEKFGEDYYPRIDRAAALEMAKEAVGREFEVEPDSYHISTGLSEINPPVQSFVKRFAADRQTAEDILFGMDGSGTGAPAWNFRFKREFDPVDFLVIMHQITGETVIFRHLADSSAGADLSQDSARIIAESVFRRLEPLPDAYSLVEQKSEKKDHRTDHLFEWESNEPVLASSEFGDTHFRRRVEVEGDRPEHGNRWLKLPEMWERHEKEHNLPWIINTVGIVLLLVGGGILALVSFGKRIARKEIRWKIGIPAAVIVAVATTIGLWNGWGNIWEGYSTSMPENTWLTMMLVGFAMAIVRAGLFALIVVCLADALARSRYSKEDGSPHPSLEPSPWSMPGFAPGQVAWDGVITVFGLVGVGAGLLWLLNGLQSWFNLPVHSFKWGLPGWLETPLPWTDVLSNALPKAVITVSLVYSALVLFDVTIRRGWLKWLLIVVVAACIAGPFLGHWEGNPTLGEFLWRWVKMFAVISAMYLVFRGWVKERIWTAMAAVLLVSLAMPAVTILSWSNSTLMDQGWLLIVLTGLIAAWLIVRSLASRATQPPI